MLSFERIVDNLEIDLTQFVIFHGIPPIDRRG